MALHVSGLPKNLWSEALTHVVWIKHSARHFDFHSVFLNGKLNNNEIIYMKLPPGFNKHGRDLIIHIHVALYRLKQVTLKWYQSLCKELNELGLK